MRLVVIVAGLIAGLYGVDKFLANQEQVELQQDALRVFRSGQVLLQQGKAHEAVVDFARAHALERANRDYELALAGAQLTEGQIAMARDTLDDLLEQDSNDGRANLIMARTMQAAGRFGDADSFYHRAIYGTWGANGAQERAKTRLELANLLAKRGAGPELLPELLLLQNEASDTVVQKRIAGLFLEAGSAGRAADAYHQLIRENPDDADAFAGLGRAETRRGNYSVAASAYRSALRRNPEDRSFQSELQMVEKLTELDPTSRRLSVVEKYRRSVAILNAVQACGGDDAGEDSPVKGVTNEMAEAVLENAERLWKARGETCKQPPEPFDPLPILMRKLAQ